MSLDNYPYTSPEDQFFLTVEPDDIAVGGGDVVDPDFGRVIDDPAVGPGGEDLRPGGGGDITDPGQSTGGGGEPGRDVTVVGPGGEDLETSGVVKKEDGKWYDSSGRMLYDPKAPDTGGIMGLINKYLGKDTADKLKKMFVDDKDNVNIATLGAIGAGIYGLMGGNEPQTTGLYKGKIPKYSAVRQQVEQPAYEPYSGKPAMGRRYFTDTQFVKDPNAESLATAREAAKTQAGILSAYTPNIVEKKAEEKTTGKTEEKATGVKTLPESSFLDPGDLIKKERGIVADKNVPTGDVMAEVKRLNPHLDWSKYNPNKMTMDYDQFDQARDDYIRGKGYTLPSTGTVSQTTNNSQVQNNSKPQLSDAIDLLKAGGTQEDASKILRSIVGLDQPATQTTASNSVYWNPTQNTLSSEPSKAVVNTPAAESQITTPTADQIIQSGAKGPFRRFKGFDQGGIAMLAKGRYLRGATDGMADMIPSSIDNKQPAKLSHGEFVIPADVVSHLGNGNSDAGANALYKMMDRVRKARTGTTKQGKRINPEKFTPGGIAGYKTGGVVAFEDGGVAKTGTTNLTNTNTTGATTTTGLADWAGDAVTDYIARGQSLAAEPYQEYKGPLTAGASDLQTQAFTKAKGLGGTFDAAAANQYMNPYIQNALQPQLNELRRQADISQQGMSGKYAAAGALGGARDAITRSEGIRNLLNTQSGVIGGAYKDAYDKAMQQYNTSRQQDIYDINAMLNAGTAQRGIEQDAVTANKAAFEQEREDPYNKLKFEQSLFSGLPLTASSTTPNLSDLQKLGLAGDQMTKFYDLINSFINPKADTAKATTGTTGTTSSGTTIPG